MSLGKNKKERCEACKALFEGYVGPSDLNAIRASLQTGAPLGSDFFKEKIEATLGCKVGQARRGRQQKLNKGL